MRCVKCYLVDICIMFNSLQNFLSFGVYCVCTPDYWKT